MAKKKPVKKAPPQLTAQQVAQLGVQELQQRLQAPNLGTNKTIININGGDSEFTTNKNSEIKYSLKNPIRLNVGDRVTLYEAFLNERGLNESTITFQKDIETTMKFIYYVPGNPRNIVQQDTASVADVEYTKYPPVPFDDSYGGGIPNYMSADLVTRVGSRTGFINNQMYCGSMLPTSYAGVIKPTGNTDGCGTLGPSTNDILSEPRGADLNPWGGANGQPYFLMDNRLNPNKSVGGTVKYNPTDPVSGPLIDYEINIPWRDMRPRYGSKTIKIKAGNYSVGSLAQTIQNQMNGGAQTGFPNSNLLNDKLYYPDRQIPIPGNNSAKTTPYFNDITYNGKNENGNLTQVYATSTTNFLDPRALLIGSVPFKPLPLGEAGTFIAGARQDNVNQVKWQWGNLPYQTAGGNEFKTPGLNYPVKYSTYDYYFGDSFGPSGSESNVSTTFYAALPFLDSLAGEEGYWKKGLDPSLNSVVNLAFSPSTKYGATQEMMENSCLNDFNTQYQLDWHWSHHVEILLAVDNTKGSLTAASWLEGAIKGVNNPTRWAGTGSFKMTYDTNNRFAFTNLHEPYRLPSVGADGKTAAGGTSGQQATLYNEVTSVPPNLSLNLRPEINDVNNQSDFDWIRRTGYYPVDAVSGLCVSNFNLDLVKNTKKYVAIEKEFNILRTNMETNYWTPRYKYLEYQLNMAPFDFWFESTEDAIVAWETVDNLWYRLGFSYNQLGDISGQLEERQVGIPPVSEAAPPYSDALAELTNLSFGVKMPGVVTHNDFDLSEIPSSDGLGGNPFNTADTTVQKFGLKGPWKGKIAIPTDQTYPYTPVGGGDQPYEGDNPLGALKESNIYILSDSKDVIAANLPDLNGGKSYFIIESDIIKPNYLDTTGNTRTILGIMSKKQASNDTIYSVDGIEYLITEERNLSEINISVRNPDGTPVPDDILGKNSGFIIMIDKAVNPIDMPIVGM